MYVIKTKSGGLVFSFAAVMNGRNINANVGNAKLIFEKHYY